MVASNQPGGAAAAACIVLSERAGADDFLPKPVKPPQLASKIGGQAVIKEGLAQAANAFAHTYWVAFALVGLTVVAALFLPRKGEEWVWNVLAFPIRLHTREMGVVLTALVQSAQNRLNASD